MLIHKIFLFFKYLQFLNLATHKQILKFQFSYKNFSFIFALE